MHPTPRPHQKEAREAVQQTLLNADRTKVVMACGTGKTLVALWCAEDLAKSVSAAQQPITGLVLVPSLALLQQTYKAWRSSSAWGAELATMCVCSDPSVVGDGAASGAGGDSDELTLRDLEFPVVTDPLVVRAFLDARSSRSDATDEGDAAGTATTPQPARVIFCTYQSAAVVGQAMRMRPDTPPLDFLLADEAHKTVGDGNSLSYCLLDENLPARKRIFFTATPRHYDSAARDDDDDAVASMDDERLYGPTAYSLGFRRAAQLGLIVPYKVIISVVDSTRLDAYRIKDAQTETGQKLLRAEEAAHQIALAQAMQAHGLRRAISFHSRVTQAQEFVGAGQQARAASLLRADLPGCELLHVNGDMSSSERSQLMQRFATADQAIISNARCLTEGVDVPTVDMVAFIEPKKSKVDIAQAAGRAMRPAPGKTTGYVLVPLLLSPRQGETLADAATRAKFADVVTTLRAMQEVDEFLGDALRQALHANGSPKDGRPDELADCLEILAPDGELISTQELRQVIKTELLRQTVPGWQQGIDEATAYKQAHGHLNVPAAFVTEAGFPLGRWITSRRQELKAGQLSAERKARLDEIGMLWDVLDQKWQDGIDAAAAFRQAHGHLRVPWSFITASGFLLGRWIEGRRVDLKTGRLSAERKAQLDELGMVWDVYGQIWQDGSEAASGFRLAHGHLRVPRRFVTESGFPLGAWISSRRTDLKAGRLSQERKAQLDQMGMVWAAFDQKWQDGIEAATAYRQDHGHLKVSQGFITESGFPLGTWVAHRRADLKAGKLSPERKAQLDDLGMVWEQRPRNQPSSPGRLSEWFAEKRLEDREGDSCAGDPPHSSAEPATEIESSEATETEQADRFTLRHAA